MNMLKTLLLTFGLTFISPLVIANTQVLMETSEGNIKIELDNEHAPITTENFLNYVNSGYYDGLIFHRVIPDFMIQGGGADDSLKFKQTNDPIKNEANNGLSNDRGTIAMARVQNPDSATSQFFINVKNNNFLNYKSPNDYGYAVFGKVIAGMDVVDKIVNTKTERKALHENVPVKPIYINKITVLE